MDNHKRGNILFMAQIPPPVHGAALRNESILKSPLINSHFTIHPLPLKFVENMKNLGKFSLKKILLMLIYCIKMTWILLTNKIDFAYFTMSPSGGAFYRDILFISILKIFRKKRILHFRVKGIKKTASSTIGRILVKFAFKGSEVICLSNHHTLDLKDFAYHPPYIIPNGIHIEKNFDEIDRSRKKDPNQLIRILFLSNLSVKKGVIELIEALKILKNRGYTFQTSLVGSEWDMSFSQVEELIRKKGLEKMISIEGPKYGKDKLISFSQADIFVFPTYFELFPGVILEAMQFGKAIVSTFEGSIPEMLDNNINGILVEQRNSTELADGMALFIDNPNKRENMSTLAKEKFFSKFTLPIFEQNMYMVFEDMMNKKNKK